MIDPADAPEPDASTRMAPVMRKLTVAVPDWPLYSGEEMVMESLKPALAVATREPVKLPMVADEKA